MQGEGALGEKLGRFSHLAVLWGHLGVSKGRTQGPGILALTIWVGLGATV